MPQSLDLTIEFITDRFDCSSQLPSDSNGGNQLYGGDLAKFLCDELEQHGVLGEAIDEDWGWLVMAHENTEPWIYICIYNWVNPRSATGNVWRLRVTSSIKEPYMRFFKKTVAVPNSDKLGNALRSIFQHDDFNVTIFGTSDDW